MTDRFDPGPTWLSASETANSCVEVRPADNGGVLVRHSKLADASPVLTFSRSRWTNLLADIKAHRAPRFAVTTDDAVGGLVRLRCEGQQIVFDAQEWAAFVNGCKGGVFDGI
jgi:hypothetical protein